MVESAIFAGLAAIGLLVGYAIALRLAPDQRYVGMAMALGAGVLMAVVAYSLVGESIELSDSPVRVGLGVATGALVYFGADSLLSGKSASGGGNSGLPLALGAVLDGIPESLVIGISVALTGEASIPLVIAAFVANTAESLGATPELEKGGEKKSNIGLIWLAIVATSIAAAIFGHQVVSRVSDQGGAMVNGFAGGAVLMVLANAMIPEGYKYAGRVAGLFVVLGFSIGFALEHI